LGKRPTLWHDHDQSTVTIPRPTPFREITPGFRVLAFGLVLLALCVFAWGLKYKLSLYDPPHAASHHMAAAKLLSGKERTALPLATVRLNANAVVPALLSTLVLAFFALAALELQARFSSRLGRPLTFVTVAGCARSAPFFVRPPPHRG
jgi:hypothetical protein